MNEERILRNLALAARADRPPGIDVTGAVLDRLSAAGRGGSVLLWLFTAASSAAAAAAAVVAVQVAAAREDVFGEFLESMMAVIP